MNAEKFVSFLEHLVLVASGKIMVFADRHPAHEAQAVEDWLEGANRSSNGSGCRVVPLSTMQMSVSTMTSNRCLRSISQE
jgi:hypothetical protein